MNRYSKAFLTSLIIATAYVPASHAKPAATTTNTKAAEQQDAQAVEKKIWQDLSKTTWIADGSKQAKQIVYVFSDPNCPYCHQFWQKVRPWVDNNQIQVRHIMVGILREDSAGKAAALLSAKDPTSAFKAFNSAVDYRTAIKPLVNVPADIQSQLNKNLQLMASYGIYSTPAIIWQDKKGRLQAMSGLPKDINSIFDQ
ncbi:thiol:disulfide interchange protein DsbG [Alkanindiges sp. WGS2144]|uniref:thiol:disulfide interchange protein DsbG n=1 Tax=Alkanindiges sp. WGS2144 TaxID=3366808 RepID=UPI003751043C